MSASYIQRYLLPLFTHSYISHTPLYSTTIGKMATKTILHNPLGAINDMDPLYPSTRSATRSCIRSNRHSRIPPLCSIPLCYHLLLYITLFLTYRILATYAIPNDFPVIHDENAIIIMPMSLSLIHYYYAIPIPCMSYQYHSPAIPYLHLYLLYSHPYSNARNYLHIYLPQYLYHYRNTFRYCTHYETLIPYHVNLQTCHPIYYLRYQMSTIHHQYHATIHILVHHSTRNTLPYLSYLYPDTYCIYARIPLSPYHSHTLLHVMPSATSYLLSSTYSQTFHTLLIMDHFIFQSLFKHLWTHTNIFPLPFHFYLP